MYWYFLFRKCDVYHALTYIYVCVYIYPLIQSCCFFLILFLVPSNLSRTWTRRRLLTTSLFGPGTSHSIDQHFHVPLIFQTYILYITSTLTVWENIWSLEVHLLWLLHFLSNWVLNQFYQFKETTRKEMIREPQAPRAVAGQSEMRLTESLVMCICLVYMFGLWFTKCKMFLKDVWEDKSYLSWILKVLVGT